MIQDERIPEVDEKQEASVGREQEITNAAGPTDIKLRKVIKESGGDITDSGNKNAGGNQNSRGDLTPTHLENVRAI